MAEKTFNQEFKGYWRSSRIKGLPNVQGIYVVQSCTHDTKNNSVNLKKLIYIGEAENIYERVSNHEKWEQWQKQLKYGEELCFSYTEIGSLYRTRVEAALINANQPIINEEYKDSFPFHTTHVNSSGDYSLLHEKITVKYH